MPTQKHVYTRDDLKRLPDEWWVELVDGDLVLTPSPIPWHQTLVNRLNLRLGEFLGMNGEDRLLPAPLDVNVDDKNVYQPDLMVLPEGFRAIGLATEIPTPIWVAEVISPHTGQHDLKKLPFYAGKGVREAWLVYPREERIAIHDLVSGAVSECSPPGRAKSSVIAGFALDLERFFRAG